MNRRGHQHELFWVIVVATKSSAMCSLVPGTRFCSKFQQIWTEAWRINRSCVFWKLFHRISFLDVQCNANPLILLTQSSVVIFFFFLTTCLNRSLESSNNTFLNWQFVCTFSVNDPPVRTFYSHSLRLPHIQKSCSSITSADRVTIIWLIKLN